MKSFDHRMMRWLLLPLLALLLNACSDDSEEANKQYANFTVQSGSPGYEDNELAPAATRAGDEPTAPVPVSWAPNTEQVKYYDYSDLNKVFEDQKNLVNKNIGVFFTKDTPFDDGKYYQEGTFFYRESKNEWNLTMDVSLGAYYLYGFIPREDVASASIAPNPTYSDGAVLTLHGMNTVTPSDVCVIIGAKEGTAENTVTGLQAGSFLTNVASTVEGEGGGENHIFLLFDHLYSALRFKFKVDEEYAALRTIRVRKLELIAYSDDSGGGVRAKYNATITLKKQDENASPIIGEVTFTPDNESSWVSPVPLFEGEVALSTTAPNEFMGCFVPGVNTYFKLRSTYDVYDTNTTINPKGNLIRQNCKAENTIDLRKWFGNVTTRRGHSFSLTMTVQPTYLYMLSDPDLDNPTVTIATE